MKKLLVVFPLLIASNVYAHEVETWWDEIDAIAAIAALQAPALQAPAPQAPAPQAPAPAPAPQAPAPAPEHHA